LLAVVAAATSTEVQKSTAAAAPSPVQSPTPFPSQGSVPYPAQSYQFTSDYSGQLAKSSFGPKAALPSSAFGKSTSYKSQYLFNNLQSARRSQINVSFNLACLT